MTFTPHKKIRRARALRRADIPAEERLWSNLRGRRLQNFKFIRQVHEIAYGLKRDAFLKAEGYSIIRVHNEDVYKHTVDVPEGILLALGEKA